MRQNFKNAVFAVYLVVSIVCDPASARPSCALSSNAEQPDVTSTIPCRHADGDLLEFFAYADTPPSKGFVAAKHFIEGRPAREIQITWIGANFRHHFLPKIEPQETAHILDVYLLRDSVEDRKILDGIGGNLVASLNDVWVLLSRQSHGEAGILRTDGGTNVFYVRDDEGKMWAVDAVWSGAGWELGASRPNSVTRQRGTHVLTR